MTDRDHGLLLDIINELNYVISKVKIWNRDDFLQDPDAQHIAGMALINIGEMCKSLSNEFIEEYHYIPIYSIVGMRNIAAHGYNKAMDMSLVWNTIVIDTPGLLQQLKEII